MPVTIYLAAAAVAAAVPLLVWAVASGRAARSDAANRNLFQGLGVATADVRELVLTQSATDRAVLPLLRWLAGRGRRLTPQGRVAALDRRLAVAGRPAAWPLERVLAAKAVLVLAGAAVAVHLTAGRGGVGLLAGVAVTGLLYAAPDLLLHLSGNRRQDQIRLELPDALDQLAISVSAGLGFEAAVAELGRTGDGPLADELVRTLQEMQVGISRTRALRNLAERTAVADLRHFVVAVVQAEEYGIPISTVLQTQADEMRVKRRQRAEERAQKMPVKLVFPLVLCILPALFVVAAVPAMLQIADVLLSN